MFDLAMTIEYAEENGLTTQMRSDNVLAVELGARITICFENDHDQDDTMIYFERSNGGWHSHGDLFSDDSGNLALVPIDVLQSIIEGKLLIEITQFPNGALNIQLELANGKYDYDLLGDGEIVTLIKMPNKAIQPDACGAAVCFFNVRQDT